MGNPSITPGQRKQIIRLFEDWLDDTRFDKDEAQLIIEHGDELQLKLGDFFIDLLRPTPEKELEFEVIWRKYWIVLKPGKEAYWKIDGNTIRAIELADYVYVEHLQLKENAIGVNLEGALCSLAKKIREKYNKLFYEINLGGMSSRYLKNQSGPENVANSIQKLALESDAHVVRFEDIIEHYDLVIGWPFIQGLRLVEVLACIGRIINRED